MTIIDFNEYKEKKDRQEEILKQYREVREKKFDSPKEFDLSFLALVDMFMQENYPDYYWRFEIFLDELDDED